MPKQKADIYYNDIAEYIAQRVGLTPQQATQVVFALSEFIVISLIKRLKIVLPHIGTIRVQDNRSRTTIKFAPTDKLFNWLKQSFIGYKPESIELLPALSRVGINNKEKIIKKEKEKIEEQELDNLPDLYLEDVSLVRLGFLVYLQQQFPYSLAWVNPISKKEHSAQEVRDVLALVYSEVCPEDFASLYLLWVGCNKRRELAVFEGYTPELLKRSWGRAVDAILVILEFREISPTLVKDLLTRPRRE